MLERIRRQDGVLVRIVIMELAARRRQHPQARGPRYVVKASSPDGARHFLDAEPRAEPYLQSCRSPPDSALARAQTSKCYRAPGCSWHEFNFEASSIAL